MNSVNYPIIVKKYFYDILQERYEHNEKMIDKLSFNIHTDKEVQELCQIVVDAFSKGYSKAVEDYKEQLYKLGYNVNIVPESKKKAVG